MHDDHLRVGEMLTCMRTLAADYSVPYWACGSYRALMNELEQIELDTMRHVQIEDHVLLPRFAAAAGPCRSTWQPSTAGLEALLERSVAGSERASIPPRSTSSARAAARHIGIEEKICTGCTPPPGG